MVDDAMSCFMKAARGKVDFEKGDLAEEASLRILLKKNNIPLASLFLLFKC